MAEEKKEAFLSRWSRLKKEEPVEKPAETPKPSLPPVDKLTPDSDFTGFMLLGELVEFGVTKELFTTPKDPKTEAYITGRFG